MQQYLFSDQDIEDYLDGVFEGDAATLEEYLEKTVEGRTRLASIISLYAALQEEEQPALSFSLSQSVIDTIASRETKKGFNWNGILWIAGAIATIALIFYCFRLVGEFSLAGGTQVIGNMIPFVVFIALIIAAFQWLDVHRMKKRYTALR